MIGKTPSAELAKQVLNKQELEKQLHYQLQQQQIFYLNAIYAQQLQASGNNFYPLKILVFIPLFIQFYLCCTPVLPLFYPQFTPRLLPFNPLFTPVYPINFLGLDRRYLRLPGLHLAPGVAVPGVPPSSSQSAGLRPEHFSGLSVPNYGLAEMQRRLYMTQNENILRAMSNQSAVDPGASGQSSRTAVVRGALDPSGRSPDSTPGGATTGFSPSGSAFTPVTPKVKKDNSQR